jgi:hypothetical protein
MKSWQFFIVLLLGVLCLGLSVATVATARSNQQLQIEAQARQARINTGILSQSSQQITTSLLQDMAAVAPKSAGMRELLAKHGYNVPASAEDSGTTTNGVTSRNSARPTEEK